MAVAGVAIYEGDYATALEILREAVAAFETGRDSSRSSAA